MSKIEEPSGSKYRAPALEKGLDIIEYLAQNPEPQKIADIAKGLNRSKNELFRMLSVLENRDVISRSETKDAYTITDKLFSLRLKRSFGEQITAIAIPRMEQFCNDSGHACHMALRSGNEIVVILRVENPENLSISVPLGHKRAMHNSPSGRCILAFSEDSNVKKTLRSISPAISMAERTDLLAELKSIKQAGYATMTDGFALGVTGISVPIVGGITNKCDLAVTTSILQKVTTESHDLNKVAELLCQTAKEISEQYFV